MSSINQFKSRLTQGGFRPNQFEIIIAFPPAIGAGAAGDQSRFMAKSGSMPASTVSSIPVMYRGRSVKFSGEREFQPWSVDFYTDTDFGVRKLFERWVETIQASSSTNGALNTGVYQTDITVNALDRNDAIVKTYILTDAFPTEVGAIQLDWQTNNEIATFPVTFDYNYFTTDLS